MEDGGRVRQLNLTIGTPALPADELTEVRRLVEQRFMQGVLDACERAVGPAMRLFVRRLDVRWRVSRDELASPSVKRVKIPSVCIGLGIKCMTPYEMLRHERARFVLGPIT